MPTILPTNYYTGEAPKILNEPVPDGFCLELLSSTDREELSCAICIDSGFAEYPSQLLFIKNTLTKRIENR